MPKFLPNHMESSKTQFKMESKGNIEENQNITSFAIKGHVLELTRECITISEPYSPKNNDDINELKSNVRIKIMGRLENFATKIQQKTDETIKQLSTEILKFGTNNEDHMSLKLNELAESKLIDLIINIAIPESEKLTPEEFNNPQYKKEHDYQQAIKNNLKKLLEIAMSETHKIDGLLGNQFSKIPFNTIQNLSDNILRSLHRPLQKYTKILTLQATQVLSQNDHFKNQLTTSRENAENKSPKNMLSLSSNHLFFHGPHTPADDKPGKTAQTSLTTANAIFK